jgi:hypothetical protein
MSKLSSLSRLRLYVEEKRRELDDDNRQEGQDMSVLVKQHP